MCNQMVTSEIREQFHARFVQILIISRAFINIMGETNYVSNLGFLTCLSWIVSIENSTLSNV